MKRIIQSSLIVTLAVVGFAAFAPSASADFVCPVIKTENVLNSPKGGALGSTGFYTIGGPDVSVPEHATNNDGLASPGGPDQLGPGQVGYTAIWNQ